MLKSFYEFEKFNNINYDSIYEYCLTEKVNEEQLRVFLRKKEWKRNPARMYGFFRNLFLKKQEVPL